MKGPTKGAQFQEEGQLAEKVSITSAGRKGVGLMESRVNVRDGGRSSGKKRGDHKRASERNLDRLLHAQKRGRLSTDRRDLLHSGRAERESTRGQLGQNHADALGERGNMRDAGRKVTFEYTMKGAVYQRKR